VIELSGASDEFDNQWRQPPAVTVCPSPFNQPPTLKNAGSTIADSSILYGLQPPRSQRGSAQLEKLRGMQRIGYRSQKRASGD